MMKMDRRKSGESALDSTEKISTGTSNRISRDKKTKVEEQSALMDQNQARISVASGPGSEAARHWLGGRTHPIRFPCSVFHEVG